MKKYSVDLPIAGYITVEVEAESKKEAIQKALEAEWEYDAIQELNTYEKLVEGNVIYVYLYEAEAREDREG